MRKLFLTLCVVGLLVGIAHAAVEIQDDGVSKGVAERINVVGATTSRSGLTATIDTTEIPNANINWYDVQRVQGNTVGINWSAWHF